MKLLYQRKLFIPVTFLIRKVTLYLPPFNENLPLETLDTLKFAEEGGKTTITAIVAPAASETEEGSENFW